MDGLLRTPLDGEILPPGQYDCLPMVDVSPKGARLSCCPNPFTNERLDGLSPEGMSIAGIVRMYARHDLAPFAHVWVANADMSKQDYVPAKYWESVRPKAGSLVTVRMVPQGGGGGGGKSPMRMIGMIAIMVAAAVLIQPEIAFAVGSMGFATGATIGAAGTVFTLSTAGTIIVGLAMGAVTMIGSMLLNALIPPPKPSLSDGSSGGVTTSPTLSITGTQNKANPYGCVPRVFGKAKISPPYAGAPYDEWSGQTQYIRLLFDLGYGPLQLTEVSIGNTLLQNYEGVNFDIRGGNVMDSSVASNQGSAVTATMDTDLPWNTWIYQNTQPNCNGSTFQLTFPNGLKAQYAIALFVIDAGTGARIFSSFHNIDPGQLVNNVYDSSTDSKIQNFSTNYLGTFQLQFINASLNTLATSNPCHLSGVTSLTAANLAISTPVSLYSNIVHENNYNIKLLYNVPSTVTTHANTDEVSFDITFQGLCNITTAGAYTNNSVQFTVKLFDHNTAALVSSGQFTVTSNTISSYVYSGWANQQGATITMPYNGQFDIQFTRNTKDNTSNSIRNDSFVTMLRSIQHTPPPNMTGHCLTAMRIKASNQLNGVVQTFNCIAQALLPTWSAGSGWSGAVATSNPAWAMLEVLRGSANKRPVPDSRIDLPAFRAFADWCDTKGFQYNAVVDTTTTVRQLLIDIAGVCRAILVMKNNKFSVVYDDARTTPVQMFTPKNSWGFKYTKPFFTAPHALKCRFINPDKAWQQDEVIAYATGYNSSNSTLFETVEYAGVTNSAQAYKMGMYTIACSVERPNTYTLNCDIEHLVCNRGDLVLVSHDVMRWGLGNGLVKSLTLDGGGNATTITTDEQFTFNPGQTFVLRCRQSTGAIVLLALTTPGVITQTNVLTLATPTAPAGCPAVGDLVAFGLVNQETTRCIVKSIDRSGDFNASLTLVDEGPGVYSADTGTIAPYNPNTTWPMQGVNLVPDPPVITKFLTDSTVMVRVSGAWLPSVQFTLDRVSAISILYASLEIQYRSAGSQDAWQGQIFPGRPAVVTYSGVPDAVYLDFRLRYWGGNANTPGINGDWTYVYSVYVIGRSIATAPVSMTVTYTNGIAVVNVVDPDDGTMDHWLLTIKQPTSNTPVLGGSLTATQAVTFNGSTYTFPAPLAGTYTMTVQAVSWTGNASTGITDTLFNSAAWAANAIANASIPTSSGTFAGTISRASGGQIVRPSLKGVGWSGAPTTNHDEELFDGLWDLVSANVTDMGSTPVSWFIGPAFTDSGTWVSSIVDMGGSMSGLWWLDCLCETVDYSALSNWNDVYVSVPGSADLAALKADIPNISISLKVGNAADLSDGTVFTGVWTGSGRYVQITITAADHSWVNETYISNFVVHCDAPDIFDGGSITTTSNPQTVNFNKTFHQPPTVTVTAMGAATVQIVAASITSAHFQVACTVGTIVNWAAKGV